MEIPFVGEDVEQRDDVLVAELLQQLDLPQGGDVHALRSRRGDVSSVGGSRSLSDVFNLEAETGDSPPSPCRCGSS